VKRKFNISISIIFGAAYFSLMLPLQFDRYIPIFYSVISIVLNFFSSLIFSIILYRILNKSLFCKEKSIILYFLVILAIAHSIYTVMFWSSLICLMLIIVSFLFIGIPFIINKIKHYHS